MFHKCQDNYYLGGRRVVAIRVMWLPSLPLLHSSSFRIDGEILRVVFPWMLKQFPFTVSQNTIPIDSDTND
jgi:hypothetical protein